MCRKPKKQKLAPLPREEEEDDEFWTQEVLVVHHMIRIDRRSEGFQACYDLEKLIPVARNCVVARKPKAKSLGLKRASEALISQWLADGLMIDSCKMEVSTNTTTDFLDVPWLFASNLKVGVCLSEGGKPFGHRLPLVCMEVHCRPCRGYRGEDLALACAESYMGTLAKLAVMLLHQLRALRNLDSSLAEVCGFVFPRLGTDSAVTKVTVSWQKLWFHVKFQVLRTVEEAQSALAAFFKHSVPALLHRFRGLDLSTTAPGDCLNVLPLSAEDLALFGEGSKQIASNSSIVVYCPGKTPGTKGKYLKHNPNMKNPFENGNRSHVVVRARRVMIEDLDFQESDELDQFSFEEVRKEGTTRHKFVKAVAESLETLHRVDQQAHLDLRVPNICHDDEGQVKFIDFDRSELVCSRAKRLEIRYQSSNMYSVPSAEWTMGHLDWKQFGLLIGQLTQENFDVEKPRYSGPAKNLIDSLLKKGEWSEVAYQHWVDSE